MATSTIYIGLADGLLTFGIEIFAIIGVIYIVVQLTIGQLKRF